jgi:putative ATP-dependent endonuclease of OLD family
MSRLKKRKREKARIRRQLRRQYLRFLKNHPNLPQKNQTTEIKSVNQLVRFNHKERIENTKEIEMRILIRTIRVFGFRGLQNIELELEEITVLTGMNNSGKTSILKALQIALGNKQFISQDDFHISDKSTSNSIIVDLLIVPCNSKGEKTNEFSPDWEILFTVDRIKTDTAGNSYIPIRTVVSFDEINNSYKSKPYILKEWPVFKNVDGIFWYKVDNGIERSSNFDEIPFFYMEAQRDIIEDMKVRNSFLGKMISKIEYSKKDIELIEKQINELNEQAVNSSEILSNIKETLKELDTAMDSSSAGVEITPFTKKLRDLNKGLTIYYSDRKDSFSMEYHGMGTRSWSSLLTVKAFVTLLNNNAQKKGTPFYPIIAIEEPEAHLHPNAQKKLYSQISEIKGQKIIATHSPYIAASAELGQIRSFYKSDENVLCGKLEIGQFDPEELRKISRQVVNTRGEIFFSKTLVFFEGETEEQALPIFAEQFFKKTSVELGIDFIGVGGNGNYLPFLRVAEALHIPWFILSDAEVNVKKSVKKQFIDSKSNKNEKDVIVFLEDGNNFEKQLIKDGFIEEIRSAILENEILKCIEDQHKAAKEKEIKGYDTARILQEISDSKASYGPAIAESIVDSGKKLPTIIIELFDKIDELLNKKLDH